MTKLEVYRENKTENTNKHEPDSQRENKAYQFSEMFALSERLSSPSSSVVFFCLAFSTNCEFCHSNIKVVYDWAASVDNIYCDSKISRNVREGS